MTKKPLTIKDSMLGLLLAFLLGQLSVFVISIIGFVICKALNVPDEAATTFFQQGLGYLLCSIALNVTFVLVFVFFNKGKDNTITSKTSFKKLAIYILIAIVAFFCLYPIVACFQSLLELFNIMPPEPANLQGANLFYAIFSMAILPAICEELLFRGLIFKGLKPYGKILSITLSALLFSLFHISIHQLIYPILFGLLLGVIMHKENNIIYCIAAHLTNNLISVLLMYFDISLTFNHWLYIVLALALLALFITLIVVAIKKLGKFDKLPFTKTNKLYLFSTLAIMIILWIIVNIGGHL